MIQLFLRHPFILLVCLFATADVVEATVVRMDIVIGDQPVQEVYIELFDEEAPITVANFLNYVENSNGERRYDNTLLHRSSPGFVVQGGGYFYDPGLGDFGPATAPHLAEDPAIANEFDPSRSNLRGTIAMAKQPNDPDSAASEWFVNLEDNSANLDNQNGGFTVFGRVLANGVKTFNAIARLPVENLGGTFTEIPLVDHTSGEPITTGNLVTLERIEITDSDGIPDSLEAAGPNNGDGNSDGIADALQNHVASFPNEHGQYVTLETDPSFKLMLVTAEETPPQEFLPIAQGGGTLKFVDGFYSFLITDVPVGGSATVTLYLPEGHSASSYFKLGNTPGDSPFINPPHWYQFHFNGVTGAEFFGNRIVLHFVDGGWGDNDLVADGFILDPGGPAVLSVEGVTSSGGGGCVISVVTIHTPVPIDFLVLLSGVSVLCIYRRRRPKL